MQKIKTMIQSKSEDDKNNFLFNSEDSYQCSDFCPHCILNCDQFIVRNGNLTARNL